LFRENSNSNLISLIESYRIISIFLTLSIYVINGIFSRYDVSAMILLAFCIISSAFLLMYLYRLSFGMRWRLYILLITEIIGIAVLMVLTSGLDSPFIWYFLNPLLIISCFLQTKEKFLYLAANFVLLAAATEYYYERTPGLIDYILSHSNIILSYILILILVNILFNYNNLITQKREELRNANEKLESSNANIKLLIEDIMLMYEAVEAISNQRDKREVLRILLDFAGRVTPESQAFFLINDCSKMNSLVAFKKVNQDLKNALIKTAEDNYALIHQDHAAQYTLTTGDKVVLMKVSNIREYGIIGLIIPAREHSEKADYSLNLLFFSRLGAMLLEKIEVEAVNHELAIADEQNRIADDIHDSVVQRLFAMSCMTYDTIKKWDQMSDREKREKMALAMETIQSSLKDLRFTIYNLSHKKQQINLFEENVRSYLLNLEMLSGTKINIDIDGGNLNLSTGAKKALYRIIIESTGNAIRHGKPQNIWVKLSVGDLKTFLTIKDDGTGFDLAKTEREENGLGLYNINSLIKIFNGSINIITEKDSGTTVEIMFANRDIMKKLEED